MWAMACSRDGMSFHMDYYNSYVIQPFLSAIIDVANAKNQRYEAIMPASWTPYPKRYAELQERWINADGSFPATGRSIAYRGGAFQHLANMALQKAVACRA
jgi:hypothetical protein